jgi:hypothetical protein
VFYINFRENATLAKVTAVRTKMLTLLLLWPPLLLQRSVLQIQVIVNDAFVQPTTALEGAQS